MADSGRHLPLASRRGLRAHTVLKGREKRA